MKVTQSISMDPNLLEAAQEAAYQERMSLSAWVCRAVKVVLDGRFWPEPEDRGLVKPPSASTAQRYALTTKTQAPVGPTTVEPMVEPRTFGANEILPAGVGRRTGAGEPPFARSRPAPKPGGKK